MVSSHTLTGYSILICSARLRYVVFEWTSHQGLDITRFDHDATSRVCLLVVSRGLDVPTATALIFVVCHAPQSEPQCVSYSPEAMKFRASGNATRQTEVSMMIHACHQHLLVTYYPSEKKGGLHQCDSSNPTEFCCQQGSRPCSACASSTQCLFPVCCVRETPLARHRLELGVRLFTYRKAPYVR